MATANHYRENVFQIMECNSNKNDKIELSMHWETIKDAKNKINEITNKKKRLQLLKKDINSEIKLIKIQYDQRINEITPGIGSTLFFGKGTAKSLASTKKKSIRYNKQQDIQPFNEVKRLIDKIIVELDFAKTKIITWIEDEKEDTD